MVTISESLGGDLQLFGKPLKGGQDTRQESNEILLQIGATAPQGGAGFTLLILKSFSIEEFPLAIFIVDEFLCEPN